MTSLEELNQEIENIKQRNKRVEADKAWEISLVRRIFVALSTYILVVIFLTVLGVEKPFLSAIIPATAYLISTLSLDVIKSWWFKRRN